MFKNSVVIGTSLWVLLALGAYDRLGVITVVLLSGPLVAVPLALPFVLARQHRAVWIKLLYWCGALSVVASNFVEAPRAWPLVIPWLAFAAVVTALAASELRVRRDVEHLLNFGAGAYLITGASWLFASRAGLQPMGFAEPIVELTAAHFHFAGFASTVIAACVAASHRSSKEERSAAVAALLVAGAPLTVAAGHVIAPGLELAGGVITSVGLLLLAIMSWRAPIVNARARRLVRYCSFPLVLTMAMALQYGYGEIVRDQPLSYNVIAAIHGGLNALVFSCGSLLGWRLEQRSAGK